MLVTMDVETTCSRIMCTSAEKQIATYKWHMRLHGHETPVLKFNLKIFFLLSSILSVSVFWFFAFTCLFSKYMALLTFSLFFFCFLQLSFLAVFSRCAGKHIQCPWALPAALPCHLDCLDCYELVTCKLLNWDTLFLFQKQPGLSYTKVLFWYLS